ncbi:TerD family protein [Rhabdochromatium marinum]|uniref:TerD family protein n=1 Tax=Rhabdochromatium marinum TaxID=48729 RepID=UPI0019082121|nr:TerD family protein [Rhabdochromatium marinum]MBK1649380.1 stress protein [Rhabdochromatium marinum]
MGVTLIHGANATLDLQSVLIRIGWETDLSCDVDASAFLVNEKNTVRQDQDFVFYNQTETSCGSVSLEKSSEQDKYRFRVLLNQIPKDVSKIVIAITVDTENNTYHCGFLKNLYVCLTDLSGEDEKIRFDINNLEKEKALMLCDLYRHKDDWKFRAVGQGYNGGLEAMASAFGVCVSSSDESEKTTEPVITTNRRRTPGEIWREKAETLQFSLREFLPQIQSACENQLNESNTRMILDKMFMDVLGYSMDEIKAEQRIQGRKVDYVLSLNNQDMIACESKRAGLPLRDKHVFQASSYGAYSGIRWVLLTNLLTWRVYHVSANDRVTASIIFSVDINQDFSIEDCEKLLLISRYGMARKGRLERLRNEVSALARENLIQAMLTDDVINKVRLVIKRDTGCKFDNDTIQQALEDILVH